MAKKKDETRQKDEAKPKDEAREGEPKQKPAKEAGAGSKKKKGEQAAGTTLAARPRPPSQEPRLKAKYRDEVVAQLTKEHGYKNVMAVPRLTKVSINMGVAEGAHNLKLLEQALDEIGLITGQRGTITRAKKSIANFKLRESMPIGARVTLRGAVMYEFLDRFISIALPRVPDFRGLSTRSFDGRGNYTMGLKDQLVFPEVDYSKVEKVKGMNLTIATTAKSDAEALTLLKALGFPFQRPRATSAESAA